MQAPGGIPNGLHGQRMYPYEVPAVAPKPTPFDQVNPNISRIPQSYRDDPFFKQQTITRGGPNDNSQGPAASGPNPPPVYVTPPGGDSVLLPPGTSSDAPLLLQPGVTGPQGTLPPQQNPFPPASGRNVPTPAPGRPGSSLPPTGGPSDEVLDPPPKLDSPEPSDPRSIYGPMTSRPRQVPPMPSQPYGQMQRPPYGQPVPGQYPPQRLPNGVAPASYGAAGNPGPGGPNGGQYVPNGMEPPQKLPPQYVGSAYDPTLRTPSSNAEIR
jgi:hypothetical protein